MKHKWVFLGLLLTIALAYLANHYPGDAPASNLVWSDETPDLQDVVGTSGRVYRAGVALGSRERAK